jgi:hypothetical protein
MEIRPNLTDGHIRHNTIGYWRLEPPNHFDGCTDGSSRHKVLTKFKKKSRSALISGLSALIAANDLLTEEAVSNGWSKFKAFPPPPNGRSLMHEFNYSSIQLAPSFLFPFHFNKSILSLKFLYNLTRISTHLCI